MNLKLANKSCKQFEEEVRAKVIVDLNNHYAEKEAKIQNDLAQEKVVR